ncbi:MAG: ATP-binding protein, partial [Anaerolineaceae bacterium]|nr:ATP-binding protein [Anaerolineaceae bacterium]
MNSDQAWQATLGQLQMEMSKAAFDTWVRSSELVSYQKDNFNVGVQNAYARDWLESRLSTTVNRLLTGIMGRPQTVNFVVWHKEFEPVDEEGEAASDGKTILANDSAQRSNGTINPRYTFDNFVVGASNRLAHAASMAVAENPARAYNPLFLYGGVGLGKTHLLHAMGNTALQHDLQVLYVSSEEFTNDLINAIRTHTTPAFRERYRRIDVLLIDDIQFIAGKESTQEEFFHTFNT